MTSIGLNSEPYVREVLCSDCVASSVLNLFASSIFVLCSAAFSVRWKDH
jgi:hypothetical protein